MAEFAPALNFVLDNEDEPRAYAVVADSPPGNFAIAGVNSASFPRQFAMIRDLPQNLRPGAVALFYERNFWNQWLAALASQEVASRVMDAAVNMGEGTAARLLQQAINGVAGISLEVDGVLGPVTVAAANACLEAPLAAWFRACRAAQYRDRAAGNPGLKKYLPDWLRRAAK